MPLFLPTQRSESLRQNSSSYFTTLTTNPTATQKPAAAEANTTRVRRHIRGVVSELTISYRGQAELTVRAHISKLHRTITNRHKKKANPLSCSFLVPVVVVLTAAASDSVVTSRACCHRLPIAIPDHHHVAYLLFSSGSAAGIVFYILLPIPF